MSGSFIWKIITFILSLFARKPRSVEDEIKLDEYNAYTKWKKDLKKFEDSLQKAKQDAKKAKKIYHGAILSAALPSAIDDAFRRYQLCIDACRLASNALKAHRARRPSGR